MQYSKAIIVVILTIILFPAAAAPSHAGVFDRVKGIYEAPDKLQELQQQYEATKELMEGQLEQSRHQMQELLKANESYHRQNEALLAENEALLAKMEQAEASKKTWYKKVALAVGILVGLVAAYALSVRIWRYAVWRKQGREEQQGVMLP